MGSSPPSMGPSIPVNAARDRRSSLYPTCIVSASLEQLRAFRAETLQTFVWML